MKSIRLFLLTITIAMLLTACNKEKTDDETEGSEYINAEIALMDVVDTIKAAYGDTYYPNMLLEESMIEENFGLTSDMYEEVYAETPMLSFQVDTLIAVKTNEGKQQQVADLLNEYRERLINDTMQYPSNMMKIQASRIIEREGFVFFVMLGEIPAETEEMGEDAYMQAAIDQNDIAEMAIDTLLQ